MLTSLKLKSTQNSGKKKYKDKNQFFINFFLNSKPDYIFFNILHSKYLLFNDNKEKQFIEVYSLLNSDLQGKNIIKFNSHNIYINLSEFEY